MKELPYFLALVKKNLILWTIITTGSFAKVDFGNTQHDLWSPHFMILKNYSLSKEDRFEEISIMTKPFETFITFKGANAKYSKNLKYYFGTDKITGSVSGSFTIDTTKYNSSISMLERIKLNADTSVSVSLAQSEITLMYTSKDFFPAMKKRLDSLKQIDSLKN